MPENKNPYSKENRGSLTLSQVRTPWLGYDPKCETWGPGSFHPMNPQGFLGPKTYVVSEIEKQAQLSREQAADETFTLKFRASRQRSLDMELSWLAQLRNEPGAIPEAAGQAYRNWVEQLRSLGSGDDS